MEEMKAYRGLNQAVGAGTCETVAKRGQIIEQLEVGEKVIEELHTAISRLGDRINFILSPSGPTGESSEPKEPRSLCELAAVIQGRNNRVNTAIGIIIDMTKRCEL